MNKSLVCKTWKRDLKSMGQQRAAGSQPASRVSQKEAVTPPQMRPRRIFSALSKHSDSIYVKWNLQRAFSKVKAMSPSELLKAHPALYRRQIGKTSSSVHLCVSATRTRNVHIAWHSSCLGLRVMCFQRRLAFASIYPVKRVCYCQCGWCVTQLWTEVRKKAEEK